MKIGETDDAEEDVLDTALAQELGPGAEGDLDDAAELLELASRVALDVGDACIGPVERARIVRKADDGDAPSK